MINPDNPHYGKLQAACVLGGTALTAIALSLFFVPNIQAITPLACPIILQVGGLMAWAAFVALTINRCTHHPKDKPTIPNDKIKTVTSNYAPQLEQFQNAIKKLQLNESYLVLIKSAAENALETITEMAKNINDAKLIRDLETSFDKELKDLYLVGEALTKGEDNSKEISKLSVFMELHSLFRSLRSEPKADDFQLFVKLLDRLEDLNVGFGPLKDTPLMLLAKYGRPIAFIKILADRGADFDYTEDRVFGNTALIWAIANANNEMAIEMIKVGKQNLEHKDSDGGNTALILTVAKGYDNYNMDGKPLKVSNLQIVETLLAHGADPNNKDNNGNSPLKLAVVRRHVGMIKALLENGAVIDFDWKEILNLTYEQASEVLKNQTVAYLLDKKMFEASKHAVETLLSSK